MSNLSVGARRKVVGAAITLGLLLSTSTAALAVGEWPADPFTGRDSAVVGAVPNGYANNGEPANAAQVAFNSAARTGTAAPVGGAAPTVGSLYAAAVQQPATAGVVAHQASPVAAPIQQPATVLGPVQLAAVAGVPVQQAQPVAATQQPAAPTYQPAQQAAAPAAGLAPLVRYDSAIQPSVSCSSLVAGDCCDDSCLTDDPCCGGIIESCCSVGRNGARYWFGADYLLWQLSGSDLPPLVTASPAGTPIANAGRLFDPSTSILVGNETVSDGWRSGYRLYGGLALGECGCWALTGDYFDAGRDSWGRAIGPDTGLIIGRPFYNTETGTQDIQLIENPNELSGRVGVSAAEDFQGAGVALQACLAECCEPCGGRKWTLLGLVGYRYYQHDSVLAINEDLTVLPGTTTPLIPGTTIMLNDTFAARNVFNGGEIGLQSRVQRQDLWLDALAAVAIGNNSRSVSVSGSTTNTVPSVGSATSAGGLLTSEVTNIGVYKDDRAAVIPRFRLGLGYQLTDHWAAKAGYNVIIWDDVAQAAEHLPPGLAVDPRNLPPVSAGGGPDPAFPGIQSSLVLAHGFDFGVEFTY